MSLLLLQSQTEINQNLWQHKLQLCRLLSTLTRQQQAKKKKKKALNTTRFDVFYFVPTYLEAFLAGSVDIPLETENIRNNILLSTSSKITRKRLTYFIVGTENRMIFFSQAINFLHNPLQDFASEPLKEDFYHDSRRG